MRRPTTPHRSARRDRLRPRLESLEPRALMAAVGSLDPTFGGGTGYYLAKLASANGSTSFGVGAIAVEHDSSILGVGVDTVANGSTSFGVIHLTASGTLDTTFGTNGMASVPLPASVSGLTATGSLKLLLQADGKFLITEPFLTGPNSQSSEMLVLRLNADGSADTTFGTGGSMVVDPTTTFGLANAQLQFSALQSDGGVVLVGSSSLAETLSTSSQIIAVRVGPTGTLDRSFGTNGLVTAFDVPPADLSIPNVPAPVETPDGLAIQPNGQIVILGSINGLPVGSSGVTFEAELIRLNANGSRDTSLSQAGLTSVLNTPSQNGLIVEPNGQILVLGLFSSAYPFPYANPGIARLNADGSLALDVTGTEFPTSVSYTPAQILAGDFALQPNGDVVLAAMGVANNQVVSNVYRFTPSLTPDTTFGTGGVSQILIPGDNGTDLEPSEVAVDSRNRIILLGGNGYDVHTGLPEAATDYAIARLTAKPATVPGDYTGDGISDPSLYLPATSTFVIRPSSGGPDQITPFGFSGAGQTIPAPGDYTGAGKTEIAAYLSSYGVYAIRPASGGPDITVPFGIPGAGQSIPVPADYFGTGQDDIAVYIPSIASFGIRNPAGGPDEIVPMGITGAGQSIPAPADYFGTGKADLAVYLPSIGAFAIRNPAGGPDAIIPFGLAGLGQSIPIPGDYDGSGQAEIAVYMPKLGEFAYRPAHGGPDVIVPFGTPNDGSLPVVGDFDGSGQAEIAIYDPNDASFAYRPAHGGPDVIESFGVTGAGASIPTTTPSAALPPSPVAARSVSVSPVLPQGPTASKRISRLAVNQDKDHPSDERSR